MLRLNIYHNIHLDKNQRYDLHQGKDIRIIGISVPVWFLGKVTSEPAQEVFCNYYIKNPKKEIPIKILSDGYEINLPYRPSSSIEKMSDDEWRKLNRDDTQKLEKIYDSYKKEVSSKNLLDICDGGSKFLNYRELNKIFVKEKELNIMHHITISDIEELEKSLN